MRGLSLPFLLSGVVLFALLLFLTLGIVGKVREGSEFLKVPREEKLTDVCTLLEEKTSLTIEDLKRVKDFVDSFPCVAEIKVKLLPGSIYSCGALGSGEYALDSCMDAMITAYEEGSASATPVSHPAISTVVNFCRFVERSLEFCKMHGFCGESNEWLCLYNKVLSGCKIPVRDGSNCNYISVEEFLNYVGKIDLSCVQGC